MVSMCISDKKKAFIAAHIMLIGYCLMVLTPDMIDSKREVYPFFSWSLFSKSVKETGVFRKSYIVINSIDGKSSDLVFSVGEKGIRLQKNLRALKRFCEINSEQQCSQKAQDLLFVFVKDLHFENEVNVTGKICNVNKDYYLELLRSGVKRFPKVLACESEALLGPFVLMKHS